MGLKLCQDTDGENDYAVKLFLTLKLTTATTNDHKKEVTMKNVTLLATLILALALCASAQQMIDFTGLADSNSPQPVPNGYQHLGWSGLFYVDALTYGDANGNPNSGPGFYSGPEALVAFGGGPMCFPKYGAKVADGVPTKNICESVISSGIGPTAFSYFKVDLLSISSGWTSGPATFQAFKDGVQVGSDWQQHLTTKAQTLSVSAGTLPNWGKISELRIHPSPGGSFVLYAMEVEQK
jgi:hypothetical protein